MCVPFILALIRERNFVLEFWCPAYSPYPKSYVKHVNGSVQALIPCIQTYITLGLLADTAGRKLRTSNQFRVLLSSTRLSNDFMALKLLSNAPVQGIPPASQRMNVPHRHRCRWACDLFRPLLCWPPRLHETSPTSG